MQQHFRAQCFGTDVGQKLVGNVYVDVAIEEGVANADERGIQVLLAELPLATQVFEDALKFFGEVFKHGLPIAASWRNLKSASF